MAGLKAICIGFDGTLIDSLPVLFDAYRAFCLLYNLAPSQDEFSRLSSLPLERVIDCLQQWHKIDANYKTIIHDYAKETAKRYSQASLFKGSKAFLKWAKDKGIKLALVTSTRKEWVEPLLEKQGVRDCFEVIVDPSVSIKTKPDPEPFVKALALLKCHAPEVLAIEDSSKGVESASSAGLQVIHFYTPGHFSSMKGISPDILMRGDWIAILPFLETWASHSHTTKV